MPVRPRVTVLLLALIAVVLSAGIAACGGGGSSENPTQVVKQTFNGKKQVNSGKLNLSVTAKLAGTGLVASQLKDPIVIKMTGPFQSRGDNQLPAMDLQLSANGTGQDFSAGAVSTGDRGYVSFLGKSYAVPARTYAQFKRGFEQQQQRDKSSSQLDLKTLGINPETWLKNPKNEGEEDVAGAKTTHVSSDVDLQALLNDVDHLLQRADKLSLSKQQLQQLPKALNSQNRKLIEGSIKSAKVDIWTGKDDKTLRRLELQVRFVLPEQLKQQAQGVTGGDVSLTLEVADVNKKQTIKAPANPRPWSELQQQLGSGALGSLGAGGGSALGGSSGGGSSSGGGTGSTGGSSSGSSNSGRAQKYLECVQKAKTPNDVQACGSVLGQ